MPALFVTGGTGFIGCRVLEQVRVRGLEASCLARSPGAPSEGLTWVEGDLLDADSYRAALEGCRVVLHMAALTGKARPAEHERVNVEGTRALLDAAKAAGVERFVFVSTIAVRYPEKKAYPYARAKEAAEALVKASGLDFTILRPTIVFGEGSPIYASLAGLAKAPVTPLFGDGRTCLQPILHDDVAAALVDAIDDPQARGATIDLGGPDQLTFDALMQKLRGQQGNGPGPLVHLPAGLASGTLSMLEPLLLPVLPVTAGQIYAFRYDSTAEPTPFLEARIGGFTGIDAMLEASKADG